MCRYLLCHCFFLRDSSLDDLLRPLVAGCNPCILQPDQNPYQRNIDCEPAAATKIRFRMLRGPERIAVGRIMDPSI